jgi:hypothetical protein
VFDWTAPVTVATTVSAAEVANVTPGRQGLALRRTSDADRRVTPSDTGVEQTLRTRDAGEISLPEDTGDTSVLEGGMAAMNSFHAFSAYWSSRTSPWVTGGLTPG